MNKIIILLLLLTFVFTSCKNSEKGSDKLEIAKQYYTTLDNSDHSVLSNLLTDSLLTKEMEYNYVQTFSLKEYIEWMKWDSVFDPTYKILEIEQENGIVKARISKMDKRISFLHEQPIVTSEIIRFSKNKIKSLERTNVIFNDSVFVKNRTDFLSWVDQNQPELTGFIHDQTKVGGMKYLKAIELYKNKE